ncbi:MAG: hypothetical protein IPG07_12120 [Crocinitomicaceae bacterium]|nr:hypothetical protein [Crocinitomicaceae bacterium]
MHLQPIQNLFLKGTDPEYKTQWTKVDSLERKGLYRMALAEVDLIFDQASKENNNTQVIKAVLYELKYNAYLEEDDYVLGIYRLDELITKAPSPSKEILHSLTAEVYWGYYSANAWKFADRTNVVEADLKDIRTWDLKRIAEKIRYHYLMSLMNSEASKASPIENYSAIASYTNETVHSGRGDTYNAFADTTKRWDKKIAVEICDKTIAKYKNAFGAQQCAALKSTIEQKFMSVNGEEAISPNQKSKVLLNYRNVDKLYMKVVPYDYKKYSRQPYEKFIAEIRALKGLHSKELNLTDPRDYQNHTAEILVPELTKGFYFVIVSSDPTFKDEKGAFAYMPLWVSTITYQTRTLNDANQVLVSDRKTGFPLAGAKVNIAYQEYNYKLRYYENKTLGNYVTDANGTITYPIADDYRTYMITVTHNGDEYAPNQGVYSYNYNYYDYHQDIQTHFFTDRKMYRPGQTIYFKGIAVKQAGKEREIVQDWTTTVVLTDVNGQTVAEKSVTTNKFGSFEGSFVAPFGVLTGNMTLSNSYGSTYFRVEEYKRPKFNVEMKPVEGEIKVNEQVSITGFAQAFAGNRLDGADVKYRITRSTGFHWSYYSYWYWRPNYQPKEVQNGDLITDENGEFKIDFTAIPDKTVDPKDLPIFTYTVYVDVTDVNGETHSTTTSFIVGYQSLQLSHNLQADMNNNEDYFLRLHSTNLNGQKIPANGTITVKKLKTPDRPYYTRLWQRPDMQQWTEKEFRELFPAEQYTDENDFYTWKEEKKVFETSFDTKLTDSIAIKNYKSWEPGVYLYEATAKDKNGIEVKTFITSQSLIQTQPRRLRMMCFGSRTPHTKQSRVKQLIFYLEQKKKIFLYSMIWR